MSDIKDKARAFNRIVKAQREELKNMEATTPQLLSKTVTFAAGDVGKDREIASAIADVAALLPVRDWDKGMHTTPGEIVYDPQKSYEYLYAGKDPMTHSNQTFYPGASGVYYWAIIPKMHEGIKVYPDVSGIIVAVKQDEVWWNPGKTKKYRWTAVDNNNCNWYPGQSGVHQWAAE